LRIDEFAVFAQTRSDGAAKSKRLSGQTREGAGVRRSRLKWGSGWSRCKKGRKKRITHTMQFRRSGERVLRFSYVSSAGSM
jgi:hypothetical protein